MSDVSLLLVNGYLVTVDPSRRVIENGWIHVDGPVIAGLGDMADPAPDADRVIDLGGKLVLPGLINGHQHHWASLFKNTGDGLLLEPWLDQIVRPLSATLTLEDLRVAAALVGIESIRTGTTCYLNHLVNVNDEATIAATVEPGLELGIRQVVAKELRETPDPPFTRTRPARPHRRDRQDELALAEALVTRWEGAGGTVHMALAIEAGANWLLGNATSEGIIAAGVELAERHDLRITSHSSSGTAWLSEREFREQTGGGDVDYLAGLGLLSHRWILVHALHPTDREIDLIARAGASVVTCPVSTAYTCGGVAPLARMFESGVTVALGSDGAYVNCSVDMVEQMKFLALLQNVTQLDAGFVTAERAIEMATIDAARALGIERLVGSLEPGKRADIVAFDLSGAHVTVANRPVSALVFSAHGTDADTVLIDGRPVLEGGRLVTGVDERAVLAEARARAAAAIERAGLRPRIEPAWRPTGR